MWGALKWSMCKGLAKPSGLQADCIPGTLTRSYNTYIYTAMYIMYMELLTHVYDSCTYCCCRDDDGCAGWCCILVWMLLLPASACVLAQCLTSTQTIQGFCEQGCILGHVTWADVLHSYFYSCVLRQCFCCSQHIMFHIMFSILFSNSAFHSCQHIVFPHNVFICIFP